MARFTFNLFAIVTCALLAPSAWSQTYHLVQHNTYYSDPDDYHITFDDVIIYQGVSGEFFEFEAYTTDAQGAYVGAADIHDIVAASGAGTVTITIVGHNGHTYGADDGNKINLGASGVVGRVDEMKISGSLTEGIVCASIGNLDIGGDYLGYLYASAGTPPIGTDMNSGPLHVHGNVAGDLYLDEMTPAAALDETIWIDGDIATDALLAFQQGLSADDYVFVRGQLNGTIDLVGKDIAGRIRNYAGGSGDIIRGGVLRHSIWLATNGVPAPSFSGTVTVGSMTGSSVLECHGNLDGTFTVTGDVSGLQIWLGSRLTSTGEISVGGSVGVNATIGIADELAGTIDINGELAGEIFATGEMSGDIFVEGGFRDAFATKPEVQLASKTAAARFVVNDDGADYGTDTWDAGAVVKIGSTEYDEPDPSINLALATCYKGDANSDGAVDVYDIDPFVLAFDEEDCVAAFPYLQHSRIYRNDMSCDDNLGNLDFDAFVLRLQDPEQYFDDYPAGDPPYQLCADGDSLDGGIDADTPAELSALLEEYVAPERFDRLLTIIADLADHFWYCPKGQFWAQVLKELQS